MREEAKTMKNFMKIIFEENSKKMFFINLFLEKIRNFHDTKNAKFPQNDFPISLETPTKCHVATSICC